MYRYIGLVTRSSLNKFTRNRNTSAYSRHSTKEQPSDEKKIRPYEEIPKVKGLPFIGALLDYTPLRGFELARVFELWKKRHEEYGDIYREQVGMKETVYCRSREDTEKLFKSEGKMPFRADMPAVRYIKQRIGLPDIIGNLRDEEWYRMRKPMNELLVKQNIIWKYSTGMHDLAKEMVDYIRVNKDVNGEVSDLEVTLEKWAFETGSTLAFNRSFGLISKETSSFIMEAFDGTKHMMRITSDSMFGPPLWKFRIEKDVKRSMDRTGNIFKQLVDDQKRIESSGGESLLEKLLKREDLNDTQKLSMIMDIMLTSVETTSNTAALTIYALTLDSEVQEKLRKEVSTLFLDEASMPSGRDINRMKYMNAFIKETHRTFPFTHGLPREFTEDIVLSGYHIPSGTQIMNTMNSTENMNPKYFPEPEKFKPERWLENNVDKFTSTGPFGFGARICPGRGFAMQGIQFLLIEILRNYRVEYHHEKIISLFDVTGKPSQAPRFSFQQL